MHLFLSIECSWRILNIFKGNCSLWQDLLLIHSIHFISSFILKSIYCIAIMVWNRIVSCILWTWQKSHIRHVGKKEGNTSKGNWVNHLSSSDLIFIEGFWQRLIFLPCRKKNTQRFQPKPLWSLCKEKQSHRSRIWLKKKKKSVPAGSLSRKPIWAPLAPAATIAHWHSASLRTLTFGEERRMKTTRSISCDPLQNSFQLHLNNRHKTNTTHLQSS